MVQGTRRGTTATANAEARRQLQISLAEKAHWVAAVGPKLRLGMADPLRALGTPKTVIEFLPGLEISPPPASVPEANQVFVLGRAEDWELKGLDIAARALAKLLASNSLVLSPKPVLVIRGAPQGTGDALKEQLMADTQIGANHLHIREYSTDVNDVQRDMRSSALVLLPSRTEGFGLAALEAIAIGIPVLISDQAGLAETLQKFVPNHAKNCVVPTTTEREIDATTWERQIEFVLRDKPAAFARAEDLRQTLASQLSWQGAIRSLFESMGTK